eukprot:scaffold3218_cov82-Skeletonema_dohrnii-CCMP3373.AAC.5
MLQVTAHTLSFDPSSQALRPETETYNSSMFGTSLALQITARLKQTLQRYPLHMCSKTCLLVGMDVIDDRAAIHIYIAKFHKVATASIVVVLPATCGPLNM